MRAPALAVVLLSLGACGDAANDAEDYEFVDVVYEACDAPITDAIPDGDGAVVTWGSSGILYEEENNPLMSNLLAYLGQGSEQGAELRILYTDSCDPRTSETLCSLADDFAELEPFFTMTDALGTIDFDALSATTIDDYSLVVADFCGDTLVAADQVSLLQSFIDSGGRVLALADNFCGFATGMKSTDQANAVLGTLGVRFTARDPYTSGELEIPPADQVGLLDGVSELTLWRVTPQVNESNFRCVVAAGHGVLSGVATFASGP